MILETRHARSIRALFTTLLVGALSGRTAHAIEPLRAVHPAAAGATQTIFVPIVLSAAGLSGSFFTSELTLTNRGTTDATIELEYRSAVDDFTGSVIDFLPAGRQKTVPDAIEYLRSLTLLLPASGTRLGTLRITFSDLSSPTAASATVRTTTAVPDGRAGLAYSAVPPALLSGPVYLCGLRQTPADRSNVALMNAGATSAGDIVLRVTVYAGDPGSPVASRILPEVPLAPGQFAQISQILASNGLTMSNGFVRVERVSGSAPFYAYAVINDQANSDGSFVPPVLASSLQGKTGITLPVAVEAGSFTTELVLTNFGTTSRTVVLTYVADAITSSGNAASVSLALQPSQQLVIPDFVKYLRDQGTPGVGPKGATFAGAVFLSVPTGDVSGLVVGARTSAPGGGGRYGLFYTGVPTGAGAKQSAWLYGLQQNAENRTNLAIVNTGETDSSASVFKIDLFDGATGSPLATIDGIPVAARRFTQLSALLTPYAPAGSNAYAHVTKTSGANPFVTYAVINDGATTGARSGDGAFVSMDLSDDAASVPSLEASPSDLDFGTIAVGQTRDLTVTVRNKGGGTVTGSAAASAAPFSVVSGSPFTLAAGQSQAVVVRFAPTSAGSAQGSVTIASNAGGASVALRGSGSSSTPLELSTDDGSAETGSRQDGLTIVNRLTPPRYPVTLTTARIFIKQFPDAPNPAGATIRIVAFADPGGTGKPPDHPQIAVSTNVTIPSVPSEGAFVDFPIAAGPTISSGDLYLGFQAPRPAGGVTFAADVTGPQQQRAFYSADGGSTFQGPLYLVDPAGNYLQVNILIRAVVAQ